MIIKFCFQNEIHRSSNPPQSFSDLNSFLVNMFKTELPKNFALQYITSDNDALPLTEDVYEQLKTLASSKPFKVVIVDENSVPEIKQEEPVIEKPASAEDFEVLDHHQEPELKEESVIEKPVENKIEEIPVPEQKAESVIQEEMIEKLAEDLTKANVMPKFEGMVVDEAHVKTVVSQTLRELMPLIITHVKDNLHNQHGIQFERNSRGEDRPTGYYNVEYSEERVPRTESFIPFVSNEQLNDFKEKGRELLNITMESLSTVPQKLSTIPEKLSTIPEKLSTIPEKLSKVPEHLAQIPGKMEGVVQKLSELPAKIPGAIDTLSHKISGDPYIECAEGRYPRSVVQKGYQLKEIFTEDDTKAILEFVAHMPNESNLEQLADVFAAYKQLKEKKPEAQENAPANEENAPASQ